ncbi:MAG: sulfatase-like hydrolase/transferase [Planctomycetota bacterium]|nr:sulfatase-like hydrolase/transferase [Planctomycetota bacterium]
MKKSDVNKPNVLIVMSDQHHHRFMGCAGHELMQTPVMDRLAGRGLRFSNTYCPFPLCGPSRMSFMTGRYPSTTGCLTNQCHLNSDVPTYAHAFGAGGYDTVLSGRMHFVGQDQRHGFDERIIGDCGGTAYINPVTGWKLEEVLGPLIDTPGMGRTPLRKSGPGHTGYHAYDRTVTETTVEWLHARGKEVAAGNLERPFMMTVGYVSPHCPFVAPPEDYALYDDKITADDLPDPHLDGIHDVHRNIRKRWKLSDEPIPVEWQRRTSVAYHGLCTFLDRELGRIIHALEESGLAEDTIVVYTSDHGEQLGEHGLWWKSTFYDGSIGVPMLMAGPGTEGGGRVVTQNIGLIDLGQTLLDLAGVELLPNIDGNSFRSLINGDLDTWPDQTISEATAQSPTDEGVIQRLIRRGPWKLCYYHEMRVQLFNIEEDPLEHHDRWDDPDCAGIVTDLTERILEGWDRDRMLRTYRAKRDEQVLFGEWVRKNQPAEPDALWYDAPPENSIVDMPEL